MPIKSINFTYSGAFTPTSNQSRVSIRLLTNQKSQGSSHHHHTECRVPGSKRKRRKTAPAKSRSIHSVFDCDQGCFDTEELDRSQQFVFITTGPMVI